MTSSAVRVRMHCCLASRKAWAVPGSCFSSLLHIQTLMTLCDIEEVLLEFVMLLSRNTLPMRPASVVVRSHLVRNDTS